MFLFRDVADKQLVDCHGHKAGKVDDIMVELRPGRYPVVRAIVTGHGSARPIFPPWITRLAAWCERQILGIATDRPAMIEWKHVSHIDVAVHIDLDRTQAGLMDTERAIWERWIKHIPGAQR